MKGPSIIPTFTDEELAQQSFFVYAKYPEVRASNIGQFERATPGPSTYVGRPMKIYYPKPGCKNPYAAIGVRRNGKTIKLYVHQIIAEIFLGAPPPNRTHVNHKDGNKFNNRASNLEWNSRKEDAEHASRAGLISSGDDHYMRRRPELRPYGEKNPRTKTPELTVRAILAELDANPDANGAEIARRYGVSYSIFDHIKRDRWMWLKKQKT